MRLVKVTLDWCYKLSEVRLESTIHRNCEKNCTSRQWLYKYCFKHSLIFVLFLDLKKLLKYVQQLRLHLVLDFVSISRQLHMATYLRQLFHLLYKNAIFKYRHKKEAILEVILLSGLIAGLALVSKADLTHDAIPSSEQVIYNAGEIPGGKKQHLAYVTNVNASEIQFFLRFYSLLYLFDKDVNQWVNMTNPQFRKKPTSLIDNFVFCPVKSPENSIFDFIQVNIYLIKWVNVSVLIRSDKLICFLYRQL